MSTLGEYLRTVRVGKGLSLKAVKNSIGISDSVLSHIECGKTESPSPDCLRKLSAEYQIPLVDLYLKAGYITHNDLSDYQRCFTGVDSLSDKQHAAIQNLIDVIDASQERYMR